MKMRILLISAFIFALIAVPAMAMQGNDMKSDDKMDHGGQGMQMDHSDKGETHHIMVNLSQADGGAPIKDAVGKIKVVGPDGKEQVSTLKNYNGILAGNFTFKEPGKYGVICLLKSGDKKPVFKFWYDHMQ